MPQLTLWPGEAPDPAPFRVVLRDSPDWYFEDIVLALAEVCGLPHARGMPVAATALAERIDADGSAAVFAGSYAECRRVADALAGLRPYADAPTLVAEVVGRDDVADAPPTPGAEPPPAAPEVGDPRGRTAYRVAQHWRFRCDTPEASDTLVITGVEDHPEWGVVCQVHVKYEPRLVTGPSSAARDAKFCVPQGDLDRSVLELTEEKGPVPVGGFVRGDFAGGKFGLPPCPYTVVRGTVGELVRAETARLYRLRDEKPPPPPPPPDEALGLWSLVGRNKVARLREVLEMHPAIAADPLPENDVPDTFDTWEFEGHPPLALAAHSGAVGAAEVLLEFGADPRAAGPGGDTALHFAASAPGGTGPAKVARLLCERGADPDARNAGGRTPLECGCWDDDTARVLVEFGATPTLTHAIRLGMTDRARRDLRENPDAVRLCPAPESLIDDLGSFLRREAERRHGRAVRLARGETPGPGDDPHADTRAHTKAIGYRRRDGEYHVGDTVAAWHRFAEVERAVFEEHRDLLDAAVARGAVPTYDALWPAVQMFDTSFVEWLLAGGLDPNADLNRGLHNYATECARTRRMIDLLHRYGAVDNPYRHDWAPFGADKKRLQETLRDAFT